MGWQDDGARVMTQAGPSFDQPLEMLAACHERIEEKLAALEQLVRHLETHGCDADARAGAQAVLRYFDTSGVYHHQEEARGPSAPLGRPPAEGRAGAGAAAQAPAGAAPGEAPAGVRGGRAAPRRGGRDALRL